MYSSTLFLSTSFSESTAAFVKFVRAASNKKLFLFSLEYHPYSHSHIHHLEQHTISSSYPVVLSFLFLSSKHLIKILNSFDFPSKTADEQPRSFDCI